MNEAAIRRQIGRVRETLDELEQMLGAPVPRKGPRKRSTPEPAVTPRPEAVALVQRRLRTMGVRT